MCSHFGQVPLKVCGARSGVRASVFGQLVRSSASPASGPPNKSFKPTPCRGIGCVLYATLARIRRPATGRLNSGVRCRDQTMQSFPPKPQAPFVYIVDSPSPTDLFEGYSIGMALRDALKAIKIPHFYTLATNKEKLSMAMQQMLQKRINEMQAAHYVDAYPFIHLCMHGASQGIGLTDGSYLFWPELRNMLFAHNNSKGYDPLLCMASCEGIGATSMATASDGVFNLLIGNTSSVLQSDLTVAYLSFYNQIFYKNSNIDQAVNAMKIASGDHNFYYAAGQQIKNQRFSELISINNYPSHTFTTSI